MMLIYELHIFLCLIDPSPVRSKSGGSGSSSYLPALRAYMSARSAVLLILMLAPPPPLVPASPVESSPMSPQPQL